MSRPLLEVHGLKKHFPITRGVFSRTVGYVRAVDGVSFTMRRGETLGLVGESGCGKTTAGRSILRLIEATAGRVLFNGTDVFDLKRSELRAVRRRMQIIFQDPYSSLNPRMTVGGMLAEALRIHKLTDGSDTRERVAELLETVGLRPDYARRYPHEFSGGQRQRIGISRALAVNPEFIVADEPVSALDVSIQAQIINLLQDLQGRFGLTFLFVAHDLSVVKHISNRIAVMYLGRIVEIAESRTLCSNPQHPYTRALMQATPYAGIEDRPLEAIPGRAPDLCKLPPGCAFAARCPAATEICRSQNPPQIKRRAGHVLCHHAERP